MPLWAMLIWVPALFVVSFYVSSVMAAGTWAPWRTWRRR